MNYRIQERFDKTGKSWFFPQVKLFFWFVNFYNDIEEKDYVFETLRDAQNWLKYRVQLENKLASGPINHPYPPEKTEN